MPLRTASLTNRFSANGQALHRAMMSRIETRGADKEPSEAESALIEERRLLKEERAKRKAQALQPRPSALDRLVRTHHPEAKRKAKVSKETQDANETKKPKPRKTRADKHAEKAAALEAARRSPKKPAK
jgi:alpha-ketoglutarate-dependent taurine dioxygenase